MSKSIITAIDNAVLRFSDTHGGLYPDAILIHPDIWNEVVHSVKLSGNEWTGSLWNIPVIQDNTIDTAWKLIGAPALEHKKCMLCGIVVGKKVRGHEIDGNWMCEHCYGEIIHNRGVMNDRWKKIVFENNKRVAKSMSDEYFESYKDLLFGDAADDFEMQ